MSASQINPKKIFRDGIFNLTNLYLKKPQKIYLNVFLIKKEEIQIWSNASNVQ